LCGLTKKMNRRTEVWPHHQANRTTEVWHHHSLSCAGYR